MHPLTHTHSPTLMLLRLTSTRFGSFLFILNRVSSTSVELGSSSGTGLYWVHWITPTTHLPNTCVCTRRQLGLFIKLDSLWEQHWFKHVCSPFPSNRTVLSRQLIAWDSVDASAYNPCQTKLSLLYCSWKHISPQSVKFLQRSMTAFKWGEKHHISKITQISL